LSSLRVGLAVPQPAGAGRSCGAKAARNLEPFEEVYARADRSHFEQFPLFRAVNRMNAFNAYLLAGDAR
jgi:hypothetical protein